MRLRFGRSGPAAAVSQPHDQHSWWQFPDNINLCDSVRSCLGRAYSEQGSGVLAAQGDLLAACKIIFFRLRLAFESFAAYSSTGVFAHCHRTIVTRKLSTMIPPINQIQNEDESAISSGLPLINTWVSPCKNVPSNNANAIIIEPRSNATG